MKKLSVGLLSNTKPQAIFDYKNGKGSFLYNFNIEKVWVKKDENGTSIVSEEKEATGSSYQYDSLRCEYPKTSNNIFSTLLLEKYSENDQSKLINEYQSSLLGILDDSYQQPYKDFLNDRIKMRTKIEEDCVMLNLPNNL